MKDVIKAFLILVLGGIGAGIPVTLFYLAWSWCMTQVPVGLAWSGIAKIGISFAMVAIGGGATVGLAILGAVFAVAIAAQLFD